MAMAMTLRKRARCLIWGALALLAASVAWAQTTPPLLPAELFFKPAEVLDAQLSPSGRRMAVTTTLGGGRVALFVWDLENEGKVTSAANFKDADVARFAWVNEERLVFSVIDLSEGSGQQVAPGLFSVRFDGEQYRQLVMRQGMPFITSGGAMPARMPLPWQHRLLHVPQGGGDDVIVGELTFSGNDLVGVYPMRLNVINGRTSTLALNAPTGVTGWLFDSQGQARVAITRGGGRRQTYWRAPGQDEWKLIDDSEILRASFTPAFVDDAGGLYVTRSEGPEQIRVLARFDFSTGKPEPKAFVVAPGFDFNGTLITSRGTGSAMGVRVDTDAETTVWFDESMRRVQQLADARLPGYINRLSCRRCDRSDRVVLVRSWNDRDPGYLWIYREREGQAASWKLFSRVRKGVDPKQMANVDFQRISARDGRDLPLWLTIPPGRKMGDRGPAVVLVHGGPWVRSGHWRWSAMEQFLASRGYLVIAPEFRGSTGYGDAHYRAGFKEWGQAMQDDVADAARWAIGQGWADRLCIAGASYGGYSTLMGLVRDGDLYKCGVAWVAVADPFLYLKGSWWVHDDIGDEGRRYGLPQMVGDAEKDAEMLKAASPLLQASRIRAPLLLAYGESDRRVPIEHGERLRKAMRDAGQEPQWVSYPGEAHSWIKLETHLDFARRMESFLDKHLK